jgi:hypothetical protein
MDNSRSQETIIIGKVFTMIDQSVDQGTRSISGTGMDYETGGLINNYEIVILKNNIQSDVLTI